MTKTKMKNKKFTLKIFNKILLLLIIVSGVYYLACINDLSVKSFRIQELKQEISRLDNENNDFEVKVMSLNSYNDLNQKVNGLDMVAVGEIDYIVSGAGVVAVQK